MGLKEILFGLRTPEQIAAKNTLSFLGEKDKRSKQQERSYQIAIGVNRRYFLRWFGTMAGYAGLGVAGLLYLQQKSKENPLGREKKTIPLVFTTGNETSTLDVFIYETERNFDFDHLALQANVNLLLQKGGKLPPKSGIFLSDATIDPNDRTKFGVTNGTKDYIRLSIKDGLSTRFYDPYPREAVLNGVLVGELTNLMMDETNALPPGVISIEQLGDSNGIMASAIFSGRNYQQYREDMTRIQYMGPGGALTFSQDTYSTFQQNLRPILRFR